MQSQVAVPTLPDMTSLNSLAFSAQAFKRSGVVEKLLLVRSLPWQARPTLMEEWDEVNWQEAPGRTSTEPSQWEWLFWGFFLCMALAALPLVGIRWTTPEVALAGRAFKDAVLLALPVVVPLPFLFLGCVTALAHHAASRTPAAFAAFGAAMAIGLAALHALVA